MWFENVLFLKLQRFPLFYFFLLQATENDQLKFDCHVLLHEMVSQVTTYYNILNNKTYNNVYHHSTQILTVGKMTVDGYKNNVKKLGILYFSLTNN